jgi:cytochrome c oxidase assembly protein subunit 15
MRMKRFSNLKLAVLALAANVVVILQGAVVRATGSGAGCGSHWPSCNGQVVPLGHGAEAAIEYGHRLLSLAVLILGAWLFSRALRGRRQDPGLFAWATAAFAFLLVEAMLGAFTVLLGYTGENVSTGRGILVAVHLVNSLLLVGALSGAVLYARERAPRWPLRLGSQAMLATVLGVGLLGMLILMFSGGIAAMGSTMFPSESLAEGLAADFDSSSHPLVRLRVLHPLIAITVGIYLFLSLGLAWLLKPVVQARSLARVLTVVYLIQLAVGTLNFAMLAPVVLQILHLSLAVAAFALLSALTVTALGYPANASATHEGRETAAWDPRAVAARPEPAGAGREHAATFARSAPGTAGPDQGASPAENY